MRDQEFRDALTRAKGAVEGEETQAIQWGRWTP
jgi:hypothetical protein